MIVPNFYDLKDISDEWENNAVKIIKIMKNNPEILNHQCLNLS